MTQKDLTCNKKNCCGCGLCAIVCPKKAITLSEDDYGFLYPIIDEKKCVNCGLCKKKCPYQSNIEFKKTQQCYISASRNDKLKLNSASGGVFATIAKNIIADDGIVYGCSMEIKDDTLFPMHVRIDNSNDLIKLQGSKYVQSYIGDIYELIKKDMLQEKTVLFSGTPCQVATLKKYLSNIDTQKLYTIDIICHGTPSINFFQSYIKLLEKKYNCIIKNFIFRDKSKGWSLKGKITYKKGEKIKYKSIYPNLSSYYNLFLNSKIYRENCYSCKYATEKRVGDITIGDFWGANIEHSDIIKNNNSINEKTGISCILQNTSKGEILLSKYANELEFFSSSFEKIAKYNRQLREPCLDSKDRIEIFENYKKGGYLLVEKKYLKSLGIKKYIYPLWNIIPNKIQDRIKNKR